MFTIWRSISMPDTHMSDAVIQVVAGIMLAAAMFYAVYVATKERG